MTLKAPRILQRQVVQRHVADQFSEKILLHAGGCINWRSTALMCESARCSGCFTGGDRWRPWAFAGQVLIGKGQLDREGFMLFQATQAKASR